MSKVLSQDARLSGFPQDLRVEGRPDDPLFNRPLVYGRIDTGVVEVRRPGSDEVERYEAQRVKNREEGVGEMKPAETKAANGVSTIDATPRLKEVATLYNAGEAWESMTEKLGISNSTLSKYIRKARENGLITVVRGRGYRPTRESGVTAVRSNSQAVKDLTRRVEQIESNLQSLHQSKSTPAPGIAILEDLSRELDQVKRELGIVAGGLAEITKRVRALEEQRPGEGLEMTRDLLRLLELALIGGDRRRTA